MNQFAISLGKPFGIPTRIHWTFWLLILWIVYVNASRGQSSTDTIWYVLFVFAIFACVILHELGHALAARRYGIGTKSITVLPIGGVASLEKIPENPKQELVVAFAGPLVNLVIAFLVWTFLSITGNLNIGLENAEDVARITADNFLISFLLVNIALFVFNLIPAFPMDGGRVLRALLAIYMPRLKATEWAVNVGKIFALLFVFWGFSSNPFLIFIALFVFISAQSELQHVRSEVLLADYRIRDVVMSDFTLLEASSPLSQAIIALLKGQEKSFLVTDGELIKGYLTKDHIISGLSEHNDQIPLGRIASPNINWLNLDDPIKDVRMKMMQEGIAIMPVMHQGQLIGVVDLENINEFLLIRSLPGQA